MSNQATWPAEGANTDATSHGAEAAVDKGKGKIIQDEIMDDGDDDEDEDEDDDDDDEEEEEEDEEMAEEESLDEIDPTAIRSRRTRGVRVDYTSAEALAKAGLKAGDLEDEEDTFEVSNDDMKDD